MTSCYYQSQIASSALFHLLHQSLQNLQQIPRRWKTLWNIWEDHFAVNPAATQVTLSLTDYGQKWQLADKNVHKTQLADVYYTHTRLTSLFPGLPGWASSRNVKPIWSILKQETVSGSGISWAICKSAPRSRQITTPAPHHSVFYRPDALPATQPTASKHWRDVYYFYHYHRVISPLLSSTRVLSDYRMQRLHGFRDIKGQSERDQNTILSTTKHQCIMPMVPTNWQDMTSY